MADISFPAHITVDRTTDIDGLPILDAEIALSADVAALSLPPGPPGPQGRRGRPVTTFRKMGEIPNVAARPSGLGPADFGKWWHRLDDDGMDVWTGVSWQHSPGAVGPKGPLAESTSITVVDTRHDEKITTPAVQVAAEGGEQRLNVTVPAGQRGPKGPAGESGAINESPDVDSTSGPGHGGVFSYNKAGGKFRPAPAPLGTGPWAWYGEDFAASTTVVAGRITVGSFTIPAQAFTWRPIVYGQVYVGATASGSNYARATVRLHNSNGQALASTLSIAGPRTVYLPLFPMYSDEQSTSNLSPASSYATVPAGQAANLIVSVERSENGAAEIAFSNTQASLVVYARPV